MKKLLICLLFLPTVGPLLNEIRAQLTTSSIAGTVIDANGSIVPNATVTVRGKSGQEFTATTTEKGTYPIPVVLNETRTVTTFLSGFKR